MMITSTREYITTSSYGRFGSYLEQQHFFGTLLLAFLLHLGGIALYQILPKEAVEIIPVRVLNIKIGQPVVHNPAPQPIAAKKGEGQDVKNTRDLRTPVALKKPAPVIQNKPKPKPQPVVKPQPVKRAIPKPPQKPIVKKAVVKPQPKIPEATKGISIAEAALEQKAREALTSKQYVREDELPENRYKPTATDENGAKGQAKGEKGGEGSAIGNSTLGDAEIESRYTQTLSLWLNRYKVYPVEARTAGLGGTVMLRIRINRQGRIMRYYLERASGHEVIDRAISTMVNAANPVPAVPANYPDPRPYLEFLVPIHFKP
jgi:protein TonB